MGDGGQAVKFFVHYDPADGEILGWGHGFDPDPIPGKAVGYVEPFDGPLDPLRQKYNAGARRVIAKDAAEQRASRLPKLFDLQQAIFAEMRRTDEFMVADYPIIDDEFSAWKSYRQQLRDLSRHNGPIDMIDGWLTAAARLAPIPLSLCVRG